MLLIYRSLWYLLLPLGALWHLVFIGRRAEFRQGFWQRYGWVPAQSNHPLVFHAASVGEVNAIADLVKQLLLTTSIPILITTTTPTGRDRVRLLFGGKTMSNQAQVRHCFFPFDMGIAVRLFLRRVKPRGILLVETEMWPNFIRLTDKKNVPVWLINGRLSQRSAKRYKKVYGLTQGMLNGVKKLLVQDQQTARRFAHIGANPDDIRVMGSVKFDIAVPNDFDPQLVKPWLQVDDVCWVAGSTRNGEETMLLHAWANMHSVPQGLLVLVPRHPQRFEAVADLCQQSGLPWHQFSHGIDEAFIQMPKRRILLIDEMGWLLHFYSIAHVAFVGGSLVDKGGHNPLEPALLGKPVVMGAYCFNFAYICELLQQAGALKWVAATDMAPTIAALLADKTLQHTMGAAAMQLVHQQSGATAKYVDMIASQYAQALPKHPVLHSANHDSVIS